jgi:hypothetical protein
MWWKTWLNNSMSQDLPNIMKSLTKSWRINYGCKIKNWIE